MDTVLTIKKIIQTRPSIFVIEDNKDIGFIIELFLSEEGFNVQLFATAADFFKAFKNEIPDIFLVDVMLPDGNGIDLCDQIKHDLRVITAPVIIMSAHESVLAFKACGAEEFISKPFDLSHLLDKIKLHLPAA